MTMECTKYIYIASQDGIITSFNQLLDEFQFFTREIKALEDYDRCYYKHARETCAGYYCLVMHFDSVIIFDNY